MRLASLAKSGGGMDSILPPDTLLINTPSDLVTAIDQAFRVLSWQENLPGDEMPDRWKWHLDWELEIHFNEVKRKRDEKYNTNGADSRSDGEEEIFEENAYSSRFK